MADNGVNIEIENIVEAFKMMVQFVYMGARTIVKKKPGCGENGHFWTQ